MMKRMELKYKVGDKVLYKIQGTGRFKIAGLVDRPKTETQWVEGTVIFAHKLRGFDYYYTSRPYIVALDKRDVFTKDSELKLK